MNDQRPTTRSDSAPALSEVDAFLAEIGQTASPSSSRGRLIFALDATASRQPTWDTAATLTAGMFKEVASAGRLDMQLVYYRGLSECRSSRWLAQPEDLTRTMSRIVCEAGMTQIGKVLTHAAKETKLLKVSALVFVGDAMEENPDELAGKASELGRSGLPAFMFQEGRDSTVEGVFRAIAKATNGAYCRFDQGSAKQLGELLKAVAVFATGGADALRLRGGDAAVKLLGQMR
jgi:hypothetical protein